MRIGDNIRFHAIKSPISKISLVNAIQLAAVAKRPYLRANKNLVRSLAVYYTNRPAVVNDIECRSLIESKKRLIARRIFMFCIIIMTLCGISLKLQFVNWPAAEPEMMLIAFRCQLNCRKCDLSAGTSAHGVPKIHQSISLSSGWGVN